MKSAHRVAAVECLLLLCAFARPCGAQIKITTIALSGQDAPGAEPGERFNSFRDPLLGQNGTVSFVASMTGASSTSDTGLWMGRPGSLGIAAREGQPAPELPLGVVFGDFTTASNPLIFNAGGQVAFNGPVTGGGAFGRAIWAGTPQALHLVAREGMPTADATNQDQYLGLRTPDLNDAGRIAFASAIAAPGNQQALEGIWTGLPGSLARAARSADPAPGTPEHFIAFGEPKLSSVGQTLITARILDPLGSRGDHGIWQNPPESPRQPQLVVREANQAPGVEAGVTLGDIAVRQVQFNRAGLILLPAPLDGATPATNSALFYGAPQSLHPILRAGDPAPGTSPAANFQQFSASAFLHDGGRFAFSAQVRPVDGSSPITHNGIWTGAESSLIPIGVDGDPASGTTSQFWVFGTPLVNAQGMVAFSALLQRPGSFDHPNGIWMGQPGDLRLVALEGTPFDLGNGQLKTITRLDLALRDDQLRYVFNDAGQLRFMASFSDRTSGVFIAQLPEPHCMTWLTAALLALGRRQLSRPRT